MSHTVLTTPRAICFGAAGVGPDNQPLGEVRSERVLRAEAKAEPAIAQARSLAHD